MKVKAMSAWMAGAALVAGLSAMAAGAQGANVAPVHYHAIVAAAQQSGGGESAPVKDDLFEGTKVFEKGASDVTEITMDPDTLSLVGGDNRHRAHNMVLNVVRTYTYDKPGMYNMADVDAIRNRLNTGEWHCSVHTRDLKTGESTDICSKRRTDGLRETAIISVSPKELTFIHTIRRASPGESEMGEMPMIFPGGGPMPLIAMIGPEAYANMQVAMAELPFEMQMEMPKIKMQLDQLKINGPKMQKEFKELNSPEMQKQFEELGKQFKELKPLDEQQMREFKEQRKSFQKQKDGLKPLPSLPEQPAQPEQPRLPE